MVIKGEKKMAIYENMHELIGNTPMVKLSTINKEITSEIFAKLEFYNPAGSVKDRVGKYMIADAEEKGLLKPGYTIVEGTAGNTGLGIAFAALNKGYRVIFVVPDKFSIEKQQLMMALGAEIINTPRADGMLGASAKAEELLKEIPNSISLKQFKNMSNPKAHYETTGPEIYKDMDGTIDYVVMGAGSGGTFSGVVKYLKEQNYWIVGSDARGDVMYNNIDYNRNVVLVIGSEGEGVSRLVLKECDYVASLPMFGQVNSLNASVAAGILIYNVLDKRK